MMKWGRKKKNTPTSSSSSSHSSSSAQSLISHAFPLSWFSRFKNVKRSSESEEVNVKGKRSSVSPKSGVSSDSWNGGRFYGRDDDSYWSLSFRKDRLKGEKGRSCGLKPERYNSDDELYSPLQVVAQRRKAKESGSLQRKNGCKVNIDSGKVKVRTRRRRVLKHQKSGEESGRIWEEGKECQRKSDKRKVSFARSVENDVFEIKPGRINSQKHSRRQHSSNFIDLGTIEEDCIFEGLISEQSNTFSDDELSVKWQNQKNKKIDDIMLRNENQKTSLHLRKERQRRRRMKQSQKVKAYSPRSPAKIKALEDMKRARMKTKKMIKEEAAKDMTNFNSFAVVKCSVDPEEDFRESMVEMIREKGIREPEVLEELLACYLTLNCEEYHDLIVKVFREVWIDLNQEQFHQELELINCCYL